MKKMILLLLLILCVWSSKAAELRLPSVVGSHMVLQQKRTVNVWGWAKPGASVSVKAGWLKKAVKTVAAGEGKWKLSLETPEAGGPYEISVKSDTTIIIKDVLIGEVWVCSGQSNMQMPVVGIPSQPVNGSNDCIARAKNNNIRLLTVERTFSTKPLDDCKGNWNVASPSSVVNFSAVALFFGQYLNEILGIPIGLISTNYGGTPAESWTDEATLMRDFSEIDLTVLNSDKVNAQSPTVLFNSMIHPILNYSIRGAIWYQGESNIFNRGKKGAEQYTRHFPAMVRNWREQWNQGDFPFYYVQIAPFKYSEKDNSAYLREAQLKAMKIISNAGMAVTMDIGDSDCIHPAEKILVGKRLAYWALAKTYGIEALPCSGPVYKDMTINKNKAILRFDYAENGLSDFGNELQGFVVAGEDRQFHPAKAKITNNNLEVKSEKVKNLVAVRYCWENYAVGTLFNTAGLPASSFRTDDWEE
jgi:sialate O-acetylesterase